MICCVFFFRNFIANFIGFLGFTPFESIWDVNGSIFSTTNHTFSRHLDNLHFFFFFVFCLIARFLLSPLLISIYLKYDLLKCESICGICAAWNRRSTFDICFSSASPIFFGSFFGFYFAFGRNGTIWPIHCKQPFHQNDGGQWYCGEWRHFIASHVTTAALNMGIS